MRANRASYRNMGLALFVFQGDLMSLIDLFGISGEWRKTDSQNVRRRNILRKHGGNYKSAGNALQRLANRTNDQQVARAARADATHFFNLARSNRK